MKRRPTHHSPLTTHSCFGFTLLELILALGLSVVVIAAIGTAIHLNLRSLEARRGQIEQAQVARAVLQVMADDIRSAIRYEPIDTSEIESLASGSADLLDQVDPALLPQDTDLGEDDEASQTEEEVSSAAPPTVPGLYGTQYTIQVDVSRLPRPDQYEIMLANAGTAVANVVSDVKSVTYYVQGYGQTGLATASNTLQDANASPEASAATGAAGLVRRELDRAVASWADLNGTLANFDVAGKVIAPEVTYLEFRYFDGTQWLTAWDSEAQGGLPMAVDIVMTVQRPNAGTNPISMPVAAAGDPSSGQIVYRRVVHLPMAQLPAEEESVEEFLGMEPTTP